MVATRRRRATHEALDPAHRLALAQPTHGQRKQHLVQVVPLTFFQQTDRGGGAQPRQADLVERAPERGQMLPSGVAPAVHLLAPLARLGHPPVAFGPEQPLDGAPELLQNAVLHLVPRWLEPIPQC